jgi:energy-coupling factor transport system substrate-specific component
LLLVLFVLGLCAYLDITNTALLSSLVVICALIPFFVRFERQHPRPRDFMPIVVLAALAAGGRIIFAPFPNFKPVIAIVIVSALSFGRQAGFFVGALAALASNIFFGQGPWTPWQMYAWGLVGYLAGTLSDAGLFRKPVFVYVFGFCSALFFGLILDTWTAIGFVRPFSLTALLAVYAAGLPFSLTQAMATVIFLLPILQPWSKKFERIKKKYGID